MMQKALAIYSDDEGIHTQYEGKGDKTSLNGYLEKGWKVISTCAMLSGGNTLFKPHILVIIENPTLPKSSNTSVPDITNGISDLEI